MAAHGFETHTRTIVKAVCWRIIATLTTMFIVFLFTKNEALSLGVGGMDVLLKLVFYYLHERGWHKISWGKKKHPLGSLDLHKDLEAGDMDKVKGLLRDLGYLD